MALIHHPDLRVNSNVPDDDDVIEIWVQRGWVAGPHPDTDPDNTWSDPPAVLPLPEPTKAELLEQARELDITGRSSMDKDELAAAITEATTPTSDPQE